MVRADGNAPSSVLYKNTVLTFELRSHEIGRPTQNFTGTYEVAARRLNI